MKQTTLHKLYGTDLDSWSDEITANISGDLQNQINYSQQLIRSTEFIQAIGIAVPHEFLNTGTVKRLHSQCPFDVVQLRVYQYGYVFYVQCRYDNGIYAEYEPLINAEGEGRS